MQDERSPFQRLAELLEGKPAGTRYGETSFNLTLGEPRHTMPSFIKDVVFENSADFRRYPPIKGSDDFRATVAKWLNNRYELNNQITADNHILALNGSREGLFHAAIGARDWSHKQPGKGWDNPAILLPNPFYHAYAAGAHAIGAEAVYLNGSDDCDFLPNIDDLAEESHLLDRTIAFYFASPANPQGTMASLDDWKKLIALARKHHFMIFADECYSELYRDTPPAGILEACDGDFSNVVTFHSLSKRSNLPGLRVGFAAGDPAFLRDWTKYRNMAAPQVPLPLQAAGIAAYEDEEHVAENRRLYNEKFDAADRILGTNFKYQKPPAGFFLWLDISAHGSDVEICEKLWCEAGVRVIPGSYLAREDRSGLNAGDGYIRVAMVGNLAETKDALTRLKDCLLS